MKKLYKGLIAAVLSIPDWIVSTDGSDKYLAVPSSGVFPDTLETAGGTITFPSGVQSIYCDVFTGKWYMNTTSSQGISFNEATNTLLKQVFPVYVYSSFWEITSFPDGKFVMFWTGTLPFVNIRFLQHSRFFSRLISVIENTHGEKMDVLLDIYNALENIPGVGDITVSPTDLTPVITSIDAVGVNIEDLNASLNANFNTNIGSLLDKLDIVIEGSSESLENRINIWSNFGITGALKCEKSDFGKYLMTDGRLIIDEAGLEYDNRKMSMTPDEIYFFKYHRHYQLDVDFFSQGLDVDIKIRKLARHIYLIKPSLLPFFIKRKEIGRKVGINDMTKEICDEYFFVPFIAGGTKLIFSPPLWKLFNTLSRKPLPEKLWETW